MSFEIGENVGPYRILERLGQGGMATVYVAYHPALDRHVAIKVLHPALKEDPNFLERFRREARVVARLEHPNIVPIYDFAEHDGQPYLVMKFIEGETLKARLLRGPLTKEEGLTIIDAVGQGLSYAHGRGVLHRDIKPSNILLSKEGPIYLADFGLARIAAAGESTLSNDMLLGTPQYISPEQARGERQLTDGTDIYSLAVVLYELVVGRVPFSADTPFSIIHDHIYKPLPLPRAVNPNVPEAVQRVLLKALAKERADRYATVEAMVAAFKPAVEKGDVGVMLDIGPAVGPAETAPRMLVESPPGIDAAFAPPLAPSSAPASRGAASPVRRSTGWVWGILGALLTCAALAGILALRNRLPALGGELTPPPTRAAAETSIPSQMATARSFAGANPENPRAHEELAEAFLSQGAAEAAIGELTQAGELYLEQGAYLDAARDLAKAFDLAGGPDKAGPLLNELLTQALFLGADAEGLVAIHADLSRRYPEWSVLPVVKVRLLLSAGELDQAQRLVDELSKTRAAEPLVRAVEAELLLEQGETVAAQRIIDRLLAQPRLMPWLEKFLVALPTRG